MKYLLLAAVLLLLLAACDAQPSIDCASNPAACGALAQVYGQQATQTQGAINRATQRAEQIAAIKATEQEALANEKSFIRMTEIAVEANASQTALAADVTRAALSQATQDAAYTATAVVATQTAQPAQMTQTAQVAAVTATGIAQAAINAQRAEMRGQVAWTVTVLIVCLTVLLVAFLVWKTVDTNSRAKLKAISIVETTWGTIGWVPDDKGVEHPVLLAARTTTTITNGPGTLSRLSDQKPPRGAEPLFPGSTSTWTSPKAPPKQDEGAAATALALKLIQDAMAVAGPDANYIPRWSRLSGWTSDKIQQVESWMKAAQLIESQQGRPTHLTAHETLDDLAYELETGAVRLTPSPISENVR